MSLKIIGMGHKLPRSNVSNDMLKKFVDTSDEWIIARTGIRERRICTDENITDLASAAAEQAVVNAGIDVSDIDLLIVATLGGDYRTPSLACCVTERIGACCAAFDINAACTGFVYALETASNYLTAGKAKNILIVCAERMSNLLDWSDRNTCILFGDGAAACVVKHGDMLKYSRLSVIPNTKSLYMPVSTDSSPFERNPQPTGFLHMQGQEVFRFAVNVVDNEFKRALTELSLTTEDFDYFILHQANKRIIDSARIKLKQPSEKFPINIGRYGNLSSVSVPLVLSEMQQDGKLKPGTRLFVAAFGAGLTAGSCVLEF